MFLKWMRGMFCCATQSNQKLYNFAGKISHQLAVDMAEIEYEKFNKNHINSIESDFDKEIKKIQSVNLFQIEKNKNK